MALLRGWDRSCRFICRYRCHASSSSSCHTHNHTHVLVVVVVFLDTHVLVVVVVVFLDKVYSLSDTPKCLASFHLNSSQLRYFETFWELKYIEMFSGPEFRIFLFKSKKQQCHDSWVWYASNFYSLKKQCHEFDILFWRSLQFKETVSWVWYT